ncbi:helix-turn-helix domain-containing protein [Streptomyces sp. NPDC046805]|uniref:helix-turn-helix domain-containing protein n=1 Tax=Streptomyces sp. NPDC046805 TaxID=3155134 RepID=UPI0033CE7470
MVRELPPRPRLALLARGHGRRSPCRGRHPCRGVQRPTRRSGAGGDAVAAGRALGLHPNSVAYRLERWHEASGWDPRTERLLFTLVALRLSGLA